MNARITHRPGSADEASALAVTNGLVTSLGTDDEIRALAGSDTTVIEAGGRRVVPGLIDSHFHAVRAGLSWRDEVRWDGVRRLPDALDLISRAAEAGPRTGWIPVVGGWHPGQFDEQRPPTLSELDAAGKGHAVYVQQGYQFAFLNTEALRRAGFVDDTGRVVNEAARANDDGAPTGVVSGRPAFKDCLALAFSDDFEHEVASTIQLCEDLNAVGLTGVIDTGGGARMSPAVYRAIHEVNRRGRLTLRTRLYVHPHGKDEFLELRDALTYLHPGFGDDMLRYEGMGEIPIHKTYDGAGLDGFVIDPDTQEELADATELCLQHGWPVNIHAVKDETLTTILDVWEPLHAKYDLRGRRFSISHADHVTRETLERVHAMGIGITAQDRISIRSQDTATAWGQSIRNAPPLRDMLELGIPVGGGTDSTVAGPYDPWISLEWFVTGQQLDGGPGRDARHCLTKHEALAIYTAGSAWFSSEEHERGALDVGYRADLLILDRDYFEVPDDEIHTVRPLVTMVGGAVVHDQL